MALPEELGGPDEQLTACGADSWAQATARRPAPAPRPPATRTELPMVELQLDAATAQLGKEAGRSCAFLEILVCSLVPAAPMVLRELRAGSSFGRTT